MRHVVHVTSNCKFSPTRLFVIRFSMMIQIQIQNLYCINIHNVWNTTEAILTMWSTLQYTTRSSWEASHTTNPKQNKTHLYIDKRTHVHVCVWTYTHISKRTHTRIHVYIYTYIYIYIYIYTWLTARGRPHFDFPFRYPIIAKADSKVADTP